MAIDQDTNNNNNFAWYFDSEGQLRVRAYQSANPVDFKIAEYGMRPDCHYVNHFGRSRVNFDNITANKYTYSWVPEKTQAFKKGNFILFGSNDNSGRFYNAKYLDDFAPDWTIGYPTFSDGQINSPLIGYTGCMIFTDQDKYICGDFSHLLVIKDSTGERVWSLADVQITENHTPNPFHTFLKYNYIRSIKYIDDYVYILRSSCLEKRGLDDGALSWSLPVLTTNADLSLLGSTDLYVHGTNWIGRVDLSRGEYIWKNNDLRSDDIRCNHTGRYLIADKSKNPVIFQSMYIYVGNISRYGTIIHHLNKDTGEYLCNSSGGPHKYFTIARYIDPDDASQNFDYYINYGLITIDDDNNVYATGFRYQKINGSLSGYYTLNKLSLDRGQIMWSIDITSNGYYSPYSNSFYNFKNDKWYQKAANDGYIYLIAQNLALYCYDASGQLRWQSSCTKNAAVMPDGNLLADNKKLNKTDGSAMIDPGTKYASYGIDDDGNYYTYQNASHSSSFYLTKYNGATGAKIWNIPLDNAKLLVNYITINPYNKCVYLNRYKRDYFSIKYCEGDY